MKKIFTFLFALIFGISMLNAQTVERNGVFSNMYVGISGGVNQSTLTNYSNWNNGFNAGLKTLNYNAAIEIGKNVTPITGFSLNTYVKTVNNKINDTLTMNITGNTKFNLMNLFGGYNGRPRVFEIQTVTGIGLEHNFNQANPWDMSLNAGLEFDFNIGKERAWYITFTPMVVAHNVLYTCQHIEPAVKNADLQANIGVVYRFKSRKTGSHNFVICPYTVTEEQYEEICNMYDDCMNSANKVDTVVEVKEVVKEVVVVEYKNNPTIVTFKKNSAEISSIEMARLNVFMENNSKDAKIMIVGSADTKTGNEQLNNNLSNQRANAVADILRKNGFNNIEITT